MPIPPDKSSFFSNLYIDAIKASPQDNFFTPILRKVIAIVGSPSRICDVGCGNGIFTACLKNWIDHCVLIGVDGSSYALQQAKVMEFDDLIVVDDFSSTNLPFQDASFDLVINKDVLEHLLNPEFLVQEIVRITRPSGYVLILVPNHFPISGRLQLLFRNTIDPFLYFPNSHRWDFPHVRFFNSADFLLLMQSRGLKPLRSFSHHFPVIPFGGLMPVGIRRFLAGRYPDSFSEAFVWLFQK